MFLRHPVGKENVIFIPSLYILFWQCHLAVISRNSLADKGGNPTTAIHLGHYFYDDKEQCRLKIITKDKFPMRFKPTFSSTSGKPGSMYQLLYQYQYKGMNGIKLLNTP